MVEGEPTSRGALHPYNIGYAERVAPVLKQTGMSLLAGMHIDAKALVEDWRSQVRLDELARHHELGVPLEAVCVGNELREGGDEPATVHVRVADRPIAALDSAEVLTGPNAKAANSFEQPDVVRSRPFTAVRIADGQATAQLPPLSVAAITFRTA